MTAEGEIFVDVSDNVAVEADGTRATSPETNGDGGIFVEVNYPACQSHARCEAVAPEIFRMSGEHDSAYPEVLLPRPPDHLVAKARRAAAVCPTKAILISEDQARPALNRKETAPAPALEQPTE
ncbi:MAG: ferredoxin [Actinomycetota bacterium]